MERRQDIGKAVREKIEGLHRSPGASLWQSIDATLAKKKRRKTFLWWSLAGVALLTAVVLFSLLPRTANPVPTGIRTGSEETIDHQSKNQQPQAPPGSLSGSKSVADESSQPVSNHQAAVPDLKSGGTAGTGQSGKANQNVSVSEKETKHRRTSTTSHTKGSNTGRPTTSHNAAASSKTVNPVNDDNLATASRKSTDKDSRSEGESDFQATLANPDSNMENRAVLVPTEKQQSNFLVNKENNTVATRTGKTDTSVINDTSSQKTDSESSATISGSSGYDGDRNGSHAEGTTDKAQAATDTPPTPPWSGFTTPDNEQLHTGKDSISTGGISNTASATGTPDKLPDSSTIESAKATMPKDSVVITSETGKGNSKEVTVGETAGYHGFFVYPHLDAGKYTKPSDGSLPDSSLNRNSTSEDFPLQYGIYAGYQINSRWSVRTGVTKKEITSATRNVDFNPDWTPNNPYFANISYPEQVTNLTLTNQFGQRGYIIEHKAQYLEIPAEVLYKILQGKFGLQVTGGIGILLVQENNVTARHELGSMYLGKLRTLKNTSASYNFGLNAYYELLPGLQLNAEPVFRYYPGAIEGHKFYTLGVQAGLQYTFGFDRKN